jgi:hypothetical protein
MQQQLSNGVDAKAGQGPGLPGVHPSPGGCMSTQLLPTASTCLASGRTTTHTPTVAERQQVVPCTLQS